MIKVNANLVRLAATVAGMDDMRYYLKGVRIEPHPLAGAIIVATDGRRAIVAHDENGVADKPCILDLPKFVMAECKTPKMFQTERNVIVDVEANCATIEEVQTFRDGEKSEKSVVTSYKVLIDHNEYVDWKRVIPREVKPATATAFNPKYLRQMATLATDISKTVKGAQTSFSIFTTQDDGQGPAVVRFEGVENIFAVMMPMRTVASKPIPSFMDGV